MVGIRLSIMFILAVSHVTAAEEYIDPEVLASVLATKDITFAFNSSLTPDNCHEWDAWEFSEDVKEIWHYYRSGYDNDGNVVYVSEFGKLSYRKLATKPDDVVNDFWKYYEQSVLRCEYDAHHRNDSDGVVMLYDFEGFTLANYATTTALQHSLKMFATLGRLYRTVSYGFIFNTNFAGESFLQLAKPFLGDALNVFEIHGTRVDKWKPRLLKTIPAISLPPAYGGDSAWKPLPHNVCNE